MTKKASKKSKTTVRSLKILNDEEVAEMRKKEKIPDLIFIHTSKLGDKQIITHFIEEMANTLKVFFENYPIDTNEKQIEIVGSIKIKKGGE